MYLYFSINNNLPQITQKKLNSCKLASLNKSDLATKFRKILKIAFSAQK